MTTTMSQEERKKKSARVKARRTAKKMDVLISEAYKPLEEWDEEELAHGRPRTEHGDFRGAKPQWLNRAIAEEAARRFQEVMRTDLNTLTPMAMTTIRHIMENEATDRKGRLLIPPSVKLQAATWVVEHLLGKPTQRIEADISVKLQGVLAQCLVLPGDQAQTVPAIDVESWEQVDEED